jgi:leucyl-tRNA synthetase
MVDRFGADTVRLYTMFTAPPDQSLEWSDEGVEGSHRFLKRLWVLAAKGSESFPGNSSEQNASGAGNDSDPAVKEARREIHEALKQATFDYQRQQFNTVVSACMKIVNVLYKLGDSAQELTLLHEGLGITLRLLAPIAPHVSHHLWRELGFGEDILDSDWPQPDESALVQDTIQYVAQVNGKVRSKLQVPADADKAAIEKMALEDDNVQKFTDGKTVRKIIVVPNKLINIVAN